LAIAVLIRGGAFNLRAGTLQDDPDGYRALARNLLSDGVFGTDERPTAYRPPLYPLLLAPCMALEDQGFSFFAIRLLHVASGVGTVMAVLWLGGRWRLGGWSLLAAILVVCDPILINQSLLVMTETLAACLAALALVALAWADERPSPLRAVLAGCCLGLAALCRPTFLPWAVLVVIAEVWRWPTRACKAKCGGALLVALMLTLAPWAVRNQLQIGRPVITTTHGGYTLLLGNNQSYYVFLKTAERGQVWSSTALDDEMARQDFPTLGDLIINSELSGDQRDYKIALNAIRQQPGMFLYASLVRVSRLWGLLPQKVNAPGVTRSETLRYSTAAWYLAEFALALVGLVVLGKQLFHSPWLWGMLLALIFTAVHAVYWSDMRMRAPLMPFVALLAARGAGAIGGRIAQRKA
jgi:4-amino-4-deoxy-L-arabinose transferase-like glycosyltransferase